MSTLSEPRRPRILAQNRKLRHLKGLWLRNLTFSPPALHTADDAALSSSTSTGAGGSTGSPRHRRSSRLLPLDPVHESPLQQSRSSDNLRTTATATNAEGGIRPLPRRRSLSIGSAHKTPLSRQKALEELADGVMGDAFFSLHIPGRDEPVYVSEVRQRSANFNFSFFDMGDYPPDVSRACQLTIRVWARRPRSTDWSFVVDETMDLRRLNFIGSLLDRRFPENALVVHLEDGVYSADFPSRASEPRQAPAAPTPPFNTLMRLANLESSIDDAIQTRARIVGQINEMLLHAPVNESADESADKPADVDAAAADDSARLAERYVAAQQRANRAARRRRDELQASLRSRREAITRGRELEAHAARDMADGRAKLTADAALADDMRREMRGQRRRICSDLGDVFPISPVPDAPLLSFTICGLPLPSSVYDAATARRLDEDALSAALGHVALAVHRLQFYLGRPLPYPIHPFGSRSSIRDDISHLDNASSSSSSRRSAAAASARRDFPLHLPRGGSTTAQWRFEYAWFLLNKDIEALCAAQGLRVVDIRHTLPNLKYLLYVCSAGTEQVPERKRGGVRGLWMGRVNSNGLSPSHKLQQQPPQQPPSPTPTTSTVAPSIDSGGAGSSRRGSIDSADGVDAFLNGGSAGLPFAQGDAKFSLRTSGLRENVV